MIMDIQLMRLTKGGITYESLKHMGIGRKTAMMEALREIIEQENKASEGKTATDDYQV